MFGITTCFMACGTDDAPALMLSIDTDLQIPADAEELRIQVSQEGTAAFSNVVSLAEGARLPGTLLMVGGDGPTPTEGSLAPRTINMKGSGPLTVTVSLSRAAVTQVQVSLTTSMPGSGTKVLAVKLEKRCAALVCADGETCREGKCVVSAVDVASLPDL
jgi:hypothetical protein